MKAFFYHGEYYLWPNDWDDSYELRDDMTVSVTKMDLNVSYPPFFNSDYNREVILTIENKEDLIPVEAELLSNEEYRQRMRLHCARICPTCHKFNHDLSNLDDMRDEMSLNGYCLDIEERRNYSYRAGAEAFWEKFVKNRDQLEELIDKAQIEEAQNLVYELMGDHLGYISYFFCTFTKFEDRYAFMYSSLGNKTGMYLIQYLFNAAPDEIMDDWDLYPFLPKELYFYQPTSGFDASLYPPRMAYEVLDEKAGRFDFKIKVADVEDFDLGTIVDESYKYICSVLSEEYFNGITISRHFDTDFENTSDSDFVSVEDFADYLDDLLSEEVFFNISRSLISSGFSIISSDNVSVRDQKEDVFTTCMDISLRMLSTIEEPQVDRLFENLSIGLGSLQLELSEDTDGLMRNCFLSFVNNMCEENHIAYIDTAFSDHHVFLDFAVIDHARIKRELGRCAPLFEKYHAIYSFEYNDMIKTYRIEDFNLIETEKEAPKGVN